MIDSSLVTIIIGSVSGLGASFVGYLTVKSGREVDQATNTATQTVPVRGEGELVALFVDQAKAAKAATERADAADDRARALERRTGDLEQRVGGFERRETVLIEYVQFIHDGINEGTIPPLPPASDELRRILGA